MLATLFGDLAANCPSFLRQLATSATSEVAGSSDRLASYVGALAAILALLGLVLLLVNSRNSSTREQRQHAVLTTPPTVFATPPTNHPHSAPVLVIRQPTQLAARVTSTTTRPQATIPQSSQRRLVVLGRSTNPNVLCRFCGLELTKYDHRPCRKGQFDD
jgi:hypothetical protein